MDLHSSAVVGLQCSLGLPGRSPQPTVVVGASQDRGHAPICCGDVGYQVIRRHSDQRAAFDDIVILPDPAIPDRGLTKNG
jgi:hypothetical protein